MEPICRIACYDKSKEIKHYTVPIEVGIYIKQLEAYVRNPTLSNLKEVYDFRFKK